MLRVIDHGPGLNFGDHALLFTPFYRLQEGSPRLGCGARTGDQQGVRDRDGWRDLGDGHTRRRRDVRRADPGGAVSGPVVLVVDDEPQILRAVERTLSARGFVVRTASDGRAALGAVLRRRTPDLVVLDLNLPHLDGLTACREIRRFEPRPDPGAVGPRRRGGQGRRARPGRRRLPHEALRRGRAAGPGSRVAPSSGTRTHRHAGSLPRTWSWMSPRGRCDAAMRSCTSRRPSGGSSTRSRRRPACCAPTTGSSATCGIAGDAPDVEALRVFVSQLRSKIEADTRRPRVIAHRAGRRLSLADRTGGVGGSAPDDRGAERMSAPELASATSSSPGPNTVSGWGITTCPSRRIATIAESFGSRSS